MAGMTDVVALLNDRLEADDDRLTAAQLELDRRWLASAGWAGHWLEPHWHLLYDPRPGAGEMYHGSCPANLGALSIAFPSPCGP